MAEKIEEIQKEPPAEITIGESDLTAEEKASLETLTLQRENGALRNELAGVRTALLIANAQIRKLREEQSK